MGEPALQGSTVVADRTLANGERVYFKAQHLRHGPTGVHGYLEIWHDESLLTYDQFNFDRHADRTKLANAAHRGLGEGPLTAKGAPFTSALLKGDLDLFCRAAWKIWNGQFKPELLEGDVTSEPPRFFVKPFVIEGGGTILVGERGGKKSYIALTMTVAVDSGTNGYWPVEQSTALFINLERSADSVKRRIGAVNGVLGLAPDRPLLTLNARGQSLPDVQTGIKQAVEDMGVKFIVLDSISRAGMGNLIDNQVGNGITDVLNGFGVTWLAIAHPPRGKDTVYGSIMFENAADIIVLQKSTKGRPGEEHGVQLTMTKANDTAMERPSYLGLTFDELGLNHMRTAKGDEFPDLKAEESQTVADEIEEYLLREVGEDTATHMEEVLGHKRTNIVRILNDSTKFNRRKEGKSVFYSLKAKDY